MFPPKMFFADISYMSFHIQMSSGKMLHKRNVLHTRTLKIRGNIDLIYCIILKFSFNFQTDGVQYDYK